MGGMILSTILNLFIVPVFYVIVETLKERGSRHRGDAAREPAAGGPKELEPARL